MFIVLVLASILTAVITREVIVREQRTLLNNRSVDVQGVLNTAFEGGRVSAEAIGSAVGTQTDSHEAFSSASSPLTGPDGYAYIALFEKRNGAWFVADSIGVGPTTGAAISAGLGEVADASLGSPGKLVATKASQYSRSGRFGGSLHTASLAPNRSVYLESSVSALGTLPTGSGAFRDIDIALYQGSSVNRDNLVLGTSSTARDRKLFISRQIQIGPNQYLLQMWPHESLIGTLALDLPYIVFTSGLITSVLVAALIYALQRRRAYALELVRQRTQELADSMAELQERADIDAMLRRAAHEISTAGDVSEALESFWRLVTERAPIDRMNLSVMSKGVATVHAVAGPEGDQVPPGTDIAVTDELLERLGGPDPFLLTPGHGYDFPDKMKSIVAIPFSVSGESLAVVSIAAWEPDAYSEEMLPMLRALAREVAPVFNQLLLLEREREAARRSRQLDLLKSEFVGIVAHDLRSPMTVIGGFADLLRRDDAHLTDDEKHAYLGRISSNIKKLAELVEDVLQVARIESGELTCNPRPFDLGQMVRTTVAELTAAEQRQAVINISEPLPIAMGDEQRQWQVLTNLVSNAFKYSPRDSVIDVDVVQDDGALKVSVKDHGMGIDSDDLPRIFEKFTRVHQPGGGKVAGTGLGLYIARSLVEAQGGEISVESSVGFGSTFRYTVPTAEDRN